MTGSAAIFEEVIENVLTHNSGGTGLHQLPPSSKVASYDNNLCIISTFISGDIPCYQFVSCIRVSNIRNQIHHHNKINPTIA